MTKYLGLYCVKKLIMAILKTDYVLSFFLISLPFFQMYLMKYGYMDEMDHSHAKSANLMSRDGLKEYIMEFQKFAGLNQTGK